MRDVLNEIKSHWDSGRQVGLATVVQTIRSAPRPVGASMLVTDTGTVVGSVSGGCVEGAVYELAQDVLTGGQPTLQRYGFSDDDAFAVGLTCGGMLDIFVEPISPDTFPDFSHVAADVEAGRPVAVATVIEHPDHEWIGRRLVIRAGSSTGNLGSARANRAVSENALGMLATGRTGTVTMGPDGERLGTGMTVFMASFTPRARMLVFGAIDFAAALARQGAFLGYRVTVCDARPIFATQSRFPEADEVVVDWPHRYLQEQTDAGLLDSKSVICILTHDPKFDVPLLEVALRMHPVAFIGALGSRRTHEDRLERLRHAGITDSELAALSSPIGLDLGARTPQETAVSIAAEIIALREGGNGERLSKMNGRIHHEVEITG